ncbi:MAG: glycosyltransferase family 39 protein [Anaerolineae bacterium]
MKRQHIYQAILLLIFLLAFALRLYRIDAPSISGDEAWSWTVAGWSLPEIVSSDAETNPPLYHLLLHGQMKLAGDSELALRLPSVWLGLLALAAMARLGQAVDGRRLGTAVLSLAAISPFLVYSAQDARMYGPALLGASGSLAAFVLLWQRDGRPRSLWFWYGVMGLTAVFSHYYAFAVLLAQPAPARGGRGPASVADGAPRQRGGGRRVVAAPGAPGTAR